MIASTTPTSSSLAVFSSSSLSLCRFVCLLFVVLSGSAQASYATGECNPPSFNSAPNFTAGSQVSAVASGDLNGDGALDLVAPNLGAGTVSVLFGDGQGAFLPRVTYNVGINTGQGFNPEDVAVADLNNDGKLDVIAVGGYSHGWISVMIGDGSGNFAAPVNQDLGNGRITAITVADFNGDGKKDVGLANNGNAIVVKLGNGTGGFSATSTVSTSSEPSSITSSDINGDGLADIVSGNTYPTWSLSIVMGRSDGNFTLGQTISTRSQPGAVALADFNSDGKPDLVNAFAWADYGLELRFGDGAGNFGPPSQMFTVYSPTALIATDVNNDGKADLVFGASDANAVGVFIGLGNEHFLIPSYFNTLPGGPSGIVAGDFNADGQKDLVSSAYSSGGLSILIGNGSGAFAASRVVTLLDQRGGSLATADFNGDGRPDLAVTAAYSNGGALVYLNDGAGSVSLPTLYATNRIEDSVVTGDFNADGKVDLAFARENIPTVTVLLGTGTGAFGAPSHLVLNVGGVLTSMVIGKFDSDNNPDLAVVINFFNDSKVAIMHGNGVGGFGDPVFVGQGSGWIDTGDVNGDSKADLAVRSNNGNSISILIGDGAGGFTPASYSPLQVSGGFNYYFRLFDVDNSGLPDLVVTLFESNKVALLKNNGAGFDSPNIIANLPSPHAIALSDFNADGFVDVAVGVSASQGNVAILSGDGLGNFSSPTYFTVGGGTAPQIVVADFNGDNKPDLASPSHVGILLNTFQVLPCLSVNDVTVTEGDAATVNANFTITLSATSAQTVRANYTLADETGKAGFDYSSISGRLVFAPGEVTKTVSVPVLGDINDEDDETFKFQLANPANAAIGDGEATGTITDNDLIPTLKINDISAAESYLLQNFTVTVSVPSGKPITVHYATADGTATSGTQTNGDDYFGSSGTLTIPAGQTSATVGVSVFGDSTYEPDETLFMNLSAPTNATLEDAQGQLTITNEDPLPGITVENAFVTEGEGVNAGFIVRLSNPSYQNISLDYATSDGSALAGSDYQAVSGTVVINAGALTNTITVPILNDNIIELIETYFLKLSNPVNATLQMTQGIGDIVDDDFSVFDFSLSTYNVSEGAGFATINVVRTGGVNFAASVDYGTSDGSAQQRTRYTTAFGTLSFAAGETNKTFTVLITDGAYAEGSQFFNLTLRNPSSDAALGIIRTARVFISDNDVGAPTQNPDDNAQFFVRQHYYDFLNRVPDQPGLDYWSGQITQCGTDVSCLRAKRVDVSNAFFYEQEFQQTGAFVYRLYRVAFGNNQPFPNPNPNPQYPDEEKKLPSYAVFSSDRARIRGGANLAQRQLDLANAFVLRAGFLARYPANLDNPAFVDAILATIKDDVGIDLTGQRTAIIDLCNQGGRGAVLYRLADDNVQTNPLNNRSLIDAEYNRAFVVTQYFGYLRRNPDIAGYVFWLDQVNAAPLRDVSRQHAMVCSFITSIEYQQRFSSVVTHSNLECQ